VTVNIDEISTDNMGTVLQTQLRSGEGPDVFSWGSGRAMRVPWPKSFNLGNAIGSWIGGLLISAGLGFTAPVLLPSSSPWLRSASPASLRSPSGVLPVSSWQRRASRPRCVRGTLRLIPYSGDVAAADECQPAEGPAVEMSWHMTPLAPGMNTSNRLAADTYVSPGVAATIDCAPIECHAPHTPAEYAR